MKILVIDDDEISLKCLSRQLQVEGHEVHITSEPEKAVSLITHLSPDLIISDIMMPHISGLELLNVVNAVLMKNTPVVLMSALDQKEVIETSLNLGAAGYLIKPIQLPNLMKIVKSYGLTPRLQSA